MRKMKHKHDVKKAQPETNQFNDEMGFSNCIPGTGSLICDQSLSLLDMPIEQFNCMPEILGRR